MQIRATSKYLKISPKKLKLVADLIKGENAVAALNHLKFIPKKASDLILKVLTSAVANAEHDFNLKKENLFIKEILVNPGPMLKRWRARAFGRAGRIRKRTTHLSIILEGKILSDKSRLKKITTQKKLSPLVEMKPSGEVMVSDKKAPLSRQPAELKERINEDREIFDVRRRSKRRAKQHLDKVRKKETGGGLKKIFRRKSI